ATIACVVSAAAVVQRLKSTMWEPGPFPKASMKRVQQLEGNSVCMDCGQPETSWGGPTYGILLCVTCAGRHRSLGTHLTVIKSLTMDRWDAGQVRRMELGGNGQLRAWFKKCHTENSALEMKYRTKAATLYRDNLRAAADDDLASGARRGGGGGGGGRGESAMSPERAPAPSKGRIFAAAERAAASDLAREEAAAAAAAAKIRRKGSKGSSRRRREAERTASSHSARSASSPSARAPRGMTTAPGGSGSTSTAAVGSEMEEPARRCGKEEEYEVVFGPGGMGFTLMKDAVSRALVTRLAPGGMAFRLGVKTGDYLVGVDGHRLFDYDQLMLLLPRAPRPLRLLFEGAGAAFAASPTAGAGKFATSGAGGPGGIAGASDSSSHRPAPAGGGDKERTPSTAAQGTASGADSAVPPPPSPLPTNGAPGGIGAESGEKPQSQATAKVDGSETTHPNGESTLGNGLAGTAGAGGAERVQPPKIVDVLDHPTGPIKHPGGLPAQDDTAGREEIPFGDAAPDAAGQKEREKHEAAAPAGTTDASTSSSSPPQVVARETVGREGTARGGGQGNGEGKSDGDVKAVALSGARREAGRKLKGKEAGRGRSSSVETSPGSDLVEGSKVTVRDKKRSSKWRKGLLRRRHGDGSWTVRYSGGMEERRVAADRVRLRSPEGASSPVAAAPPTAVTGTIPSGALGGGDSIINGAKKEGNKEQQDEEGRRRSRKSRKGKGRPTNGWKDPAVPPRSWASVPGTKDVQEDFRAPGELRDDFFADSDGSGSGDSSDAAGVSALAAYARWCGAPSHPIVEGGAYVRHIHHVFCFARQTFRSMLGRLDAERDEGTVDIGRIGSGFEYPVGRRAPSLPILKPLSLGHTVVFPEGGMGLTLTKELAGGCSVTRVVPGGVAHSRGVAIGQHVCAVNGQPSGTYEQTMAVIAGSPRPISITFVMPVAGGGSGGSSTNRFSGVAGGPPIVQQSWADVGLAATITAMDAANAVAVEWGLGASTPGVLDNAQPSSAASIPPPPQGFRVHQKHSLMAIPTGVAGGFGNSLAKHRTFAVDVSPDMPTMSTKKALSDDPGSEDGEFDVRFGEGELGMRLEERGSFKASSVVVKITEDAGQAMSLGIREGCTVVGINGEKYLSHAHTVATLKHAKRPVAVRFRAPEGPGGRRR
ncbi:unnamed protein product, partial [Scytosiphon promiscuus]